jgi:ATP-dependent helicase/nuclease subunit B
LQDQAVLSAGTATALGPDQAWAWLDAARGQASPDTWLVCASRRLAQAWLAADADRQVQAGRRSWLRAPIYSYEHFVRALYESARRDRPEAAPIALTGAQERALWGAVVQADGAQPELLRPAESARLAAEAWRLVQDWRLPLPFAECNGDVEQFNRWAAQFRKQVQRAHAIDAASLPQRLAEMVAAGTVAIPKRLLLAGFDERAPSPAALFEAIGRAGTERHDIAQSARRGQTCRFEVADRERELRAVAEWARERLERDPRRRIGIVVPDFAARRADLQRVFDEVLGATGDPAEQRPYNLSLGEPLADVAVVRTALRLLAARGGRIALDDATALLLSPYWGGSEAEQFQRAELDRRLREDGFLESDLQDWQRIAQRANLAALSARLVGLISLGTRTPQRLPSSSWTRPFSEWLVAAGWPGWRTPTSGEFQALQAWNEALAEYGALSAVLPALTAEGALGPLRDVVSRELFQPRTPAAPIQVLSPLDAGGLQFDALWMMGLDDEHWPQPARPHPFIPFALQRSRGLPRSSGAQQTAQATRMLERLRSAADEVVLSSPSQEDELKLAPSPLIAHVPVEKEAGPPAPPWSPRWRELMQSARVERIDDFSDARAHVAAAMRGGTSVFKDQALCAFRGYARHRLLARGLEEPGFGPTTMDRGNMVHRTMEVLWRRIGSQEGLLALDRPRLDAIVAEAVEEGLQKVARRAPQRLGAAMFQLERQRLSLLVGAWLEMERARAPFRVLEIEGRRLGAEDVEPRSVDVAGISVTLRPDRVDEIAGGERVVIDYKTGQAKGRPWFDDRPDEPQLLIYGLQQPNLAGLAFAILRAGRIVFRGISGPAPIAAGFDAESAVSWRELQQKWQRELGLIADEVRRGFAAVAPKHLKVCDLCDLHALCHIRVAQPLEDGA